MSQEEQAGLRLFGHTIPLYVQIVIALIFAVILGILMGAGNPDEAHKTFIENLAVPCTLILKALRALATPLILLAVLNSFLTTEIPGRAGRRLAFLLITNTLAAILIGLLVANVLRPGTWGQLPAPTQAAEQKALDPWSLLQDSIPEAVIQPLVNNNVIQLIVVALAFGIALRAIKSVQLEQGRSDFLPIQHAVGTMFAVIIKVLTWVIALVPIAVFGIVARTIALKGFEPFKTLGALVIAVLLALFLQACYYLVRVRMGSWVNPVQFLRAGSDALITAFSTASSTATMPITFKGLEEKLGLRQVSASLGALVGSNFNNDGTALYEAMAALFISQVLNINLSFPQQLLVIFTSIFASVGAAGIPEAGLVTMTLVFTSVGLPTEYIALLITVDWFLDRCRTAINVMGDMAVSCLLDGKQPQAAIAPTFEDDLVAGRN